jgi:tetratricopeptide (TPR) repeat protein
LCRCTRAPRPAVERIAILPFENLTGDPAFDWIRDAGPAILTEEIAGAPHTFALRTPTISEATLAGASRFLHCGVSRNFKGSGESLHFEIAIEDAARHKIVSATVLDGSALFAADALARILDPAAQPFSSRNSEAIAAWGRGDFERAVALDPDFGTAWNGWVQMLARSGQPDEALLTAEKALGRASLRSPLNKAQLQLEAASLQKDEPARVTALNQLAAMAPTDIGTALALAEVEQRLRNFAKSAEWYRRILTMEPGNTAALNGLGYAEGEAGHAETATQILQQYAREPNQANNALDSLGEIYFMNGRFAEAENYFSQAAARDPNFLDGAPVMKAAYAHWFAPAHDQAGADAIMRRYLDNRAQRGDPTVVWRESVWLYATGRAKEAIARLTSAPPEQKATIERQLLVWRGDVKPPTDLIQLKKIYEGTNPAADGLIRTIYAATLLNAGKSDEARGLLQRWPLPESAGDPMLQSLVFPEFLELRQKLGIH